MRLIIAGTRNFFDYEYFKKTVDSILKETPKEIISGGAKGADYLAYRYAHEKKIPFTEVRAEWEKHGKAAGPIRNKAMASMGTHCIVFWNGKSRGTRNMIDNATCSNLRLIVHDYIKKCETLRWL
jgi:orotate phosphoribosyltransferase